jgi:DtxR family Mn-dependent transcriptional regulator
MGAIPKETVEEVMENLVAILEKQGKTTGPKLAKRMNISLEELNSYLPALREMGYLKVEGDRLFPTKKGSRLGKRMVRKHRLLERFLHDVLGLKKDQVHEEACKLEHALSDEAEIALCRYLDHPQNCPDDKRPIPVCNVDVASCEECGEGSSKNDRGQLMPLTNVEQGKTVKVRFIRGGKKAVQRLRDMGLVPDVVVRIVKKAPFRGPVELEVCSTKLALGRGIADKVYVEVC